MNFAQMKMIILVLCALMLPAMPLGAAKRKHPDAHHTIYVQFQMKATNSTSWSTSSTTLRGLVNESMIHNTLASRFPDHKIRILSVNTGKPVRHLVQYQLSRDRKSWSTGSTVLLDARTMSMAQNQISARHPGMHVRILNMTKQ